MDLAEARKIFEQKGYYVSPAPGGVFVDSEYSDTVIINRVMICERQGNWWAYGDAIILGGSDQLRQVVEITFVYYNMKDLCTDDVRDAMWRLQKPHLYAEIVSSKEIRIRDIRIEEEDWWDKYDYMEHAIHSDNYQHTVIIRLEEDGWDVIATDSEGNSETTHVETLDDAVEKVIAICSCSDG